MYTNVLVGFHPEIMNFNHVEKLKTQMVLTMAQLGGLLQPFLTILNSTHGI